MIANGYRINVILRKPRRRWTRALPDEDISHLLAEIGRSSTTGGQKSQVERLTRPTKYIAVDTVFGDGKPVKRHYGVVTLPTMSTGATDMSFARSRRAMLRHRPNARR
jgi:hypothetical protein